MYFDGTFEIHIIENPNTIKNSLALTHVPIISNIDPYYFVIVIKVLAYVCRCAKHSKHQKSIMS